MPDLNPYTIVGINVISDEGETAETRHDIVPAAGRSNANWQISGRGLYFPTKASVRKYFKKRYDKVKEE